MTWNNNRYLEECLVIVACLLLNSCVSPDARSPYKQYAQVSNSSAPISTNDKEALKKAIVIHLVPSKKIKTSITTEDPIIVTNNVYSNYKVFEIKGDINTRYNIELRSLCDCFGMNKLVLYPIARLVDAQGEIINNKPSDVALRDPDMKYPVNIQMNWEGTFNKNGKYYFLVSAYNENIGSSYITFSEFDFLASQIQKLPLAEAYLDLMNSVGNREDEIKNPSLHPLWAFPTGKIVVTLRTEKQ
ncbi:MAG: hypothetical protein HN931_05780 [Desulfobacterales bacterium]|jgi:hypothetical protein|nr:hypothetical protein [Desulfobacteraceae bacterium]MBT4364619.1 hypothetical protein [Desulfobacteraceae bacterium]MBT7085665.1 hypothetical protein [Desulfobacterales bacterium]